MPSNNSVRDQQFLDTQICATHPNSIPLANQDIDAINIHVCSAISTSIAELLIQLLFTGLYIM